MTALTDAKSRNTAYEYTWKNNISKLSKAQERSVQLPEEIFIIKWRPQIKHIDRQGG
jgi:hypothetical protein